MKITLYLLFFALALTGCSEADRNLDLTAIKKNFINSIFESYIDEGPFHMNYHIRTILFSDNVVSLLGEIFIYDRLPHGWSKFESKTFVKVNNSFKEITLNDLFRSQNQKEFLRCYCEDFFKHKCDQCNYFNDKDPLCDFLDLDYIKLFVVNHESLIVIFQPYTVGGLGDEPFIVKIPFTELAGKWQTGNPLELHLPITNNFLSSWDSDKWISDVSEDHSIANQTQLP